MRISLKMIGILVVSFIIIAGSLFSIAIFSLYSSQDKNLNLCNNEIVELTFELLESNEELFFHNLDRELAISDVSTESDVMNFIKSIDPSGKNVILFDIEGMDFIENYGNPDLGRLLDDKTLDRFLSDWTLNGKTDFDVDNFKEFLESDFSFVPSKVHFRIYSDFNMIVGYGKTVKTAKVRVDFIKHENRNIYKMQLMATLLVLIIVITSVSVISISIMRRSIISPIKEMNEGFDKVKQGNLNVRLKSQSRDELGNLVKSFNSTVSELKKNSKKLENYNKELEKKVKELENFNRIVVGRELKMVELKKKIKSYEEAGKRKKPE